MQVKIGPYINYIGPYQIADLLMRFGLSEDRCYKIGEKLADIPFLCKMCEWIHKKRKRKIKIIIDAYDVWSMDHTLALIILPMLKKLKEVKHGSPIIDNEDVPESFRYNNWASNESMQYDLFADSDYDELVWNKLHEKWEWVLNEMIWAFECKLDNTIENMIYKEIETLDDSESDFPYYQRLRKIDIEAIKRYNQRLSNGFRLFGKYYEGLWD